MAGLKQAMAMSIAVYAIDAYFNKKYIKAIIILFIASLFHPFVLAFAVIPFFTKRTWTINTLVIMAIALFGMLNLETVFSLFSVFGKEYSTTTVNDYTINPFRVVVSAVPIVIMFFFRKQINATNDRFFILGSICR
jgi:hypothetical protein